MILTKVVARPCVMMTHIGGSQPGIDTDLEDTEKNRTRRKENADSA